MSDMAHVLWSLVAFALVGGATACVSLWLKLKAQALQRTEERAERETGAVAVLGKRIEACLEDMRQMRIDMKTFQANNRR